MPTLSNNATWMNTLLIAATIGVIVVCLFGGYTAWNAAENSEQILRNSQVQFQLRSIVAAIKDAETGQRGFLITGDEGYLSSFHTGFSKADELLASLHHHSTTGQLTLEQFAQLKQLLADKRETLQSAIDARREGPDEVAFAKARDVVATGRSKALMDQIEALTGEILAAQDDKQNELERRANRLAGQHVAALSVGLVLTLGTFLAAAGVTHRETFERNRAVLKLRTERARHVAVIDASMDAIVAVDHEGIVVMLNPMAETLFQQRERDVCGQAFLRFVAEKFRPEFSELLNPAKTDAPLRSRVADGDVVFARRFDGREIPVEAVVSRSRIDGDELLFTVMLRDVTEREAGRMRLREQTEILARIRDSIHVRDLQDRIQTWNDGAQKLFGWEAAEAIGKTASSLIGGPSEQSEAQILIDLLANGMWSGRREVTTKDGRVRDIESRRSLIVNNAGQPTSQLVIDIDITEEKRRERAERRSQRLESIGTLTSGIAHDLNNILTPITMGARLLRHHAVTDQTAGLIDTIISSADRGTGMIRQLLSFAGGSSGPRRLVNMKELIDETCGILRHTLTSKISIRAHVESSLLPILADATELSQVLMNLAINARDAMPNGGELTFEASNITLREDAKQLQLPRGRFVRVSVIDSGIGMPPDVTDRIFDPFFTTKEQGKGTGLGLATCLGIIKSHDGAISVYSEPGHGTKFTFYIPAQEDGTESQTQTVESESLDGQGQTILLIDDEESILRVAKATLELHGYRALTAVGGAEGTNMFQQEQSSIDVVIVDIMMPGIDGNEVIKAVKAIRANVPIIATSGLKKPEYGKASFESTAGFLSKPYSDEQLLRIVQSTLKNNPLIKAVSAES
jgi:PAS domain S-box-containing protein